MGLGEVLGYAGLNDEAAAAVKEALRVLRAEGAPR